MTIYKYSKKPKAELVKFPSKYELLNLRENPFPSYLFVNPNSDDPRYNFLIKLS